ncbi:hypothetical protein OG814_01440 [Streptomyces zaomyceticus]|uniref:Uncharacterized protein n=1 Tax=Streptomyces zaomyceticus TaxID=68286 RepID=A0ABZ1L3Y3_9ACTN
MPSGSSGYEERGADSVGGRGTELYPREAVEAGEQEPRSSEPVPGSGAKAGRFADRQVSGVPDESGPRPHVVEADGVVLTIGSR